MENFEVFLKNWSDELWKSKAIQLHFQHEAHFFQAFEKLWSSQNYSLQTGGKRFRPRLVLAVADALQMNSKNFLPWAAAIEMVHTYSLIHDDLPCMDNDDERRGKPTNHKVYGEAAALLAGDSLLTESFSLLSRSYFDQPILAVQLIRLLSEVAGARGMIGGQALDLFSDFNMNSNEIQDLHYLKTAALIRACLEGAALIAGLPKEQQKALADFGDCLGLAFQVKDDLLDIHEKEEVQKNLAQQIGPEETHLFLNQISAKAEKYLELLPGYSLGKWNSLSHLLQQNQSRTV